MNESIRYKILMRLIYFQVILESYKQACNKKYLDNIKYKRFVSHNTVQ